MGQRTGFNRQLNDTTKRFTYFVPRDWAWQQTETEFPSLHKKLFMPEYEYHVSQINFNIYHKTYRGDGGTRRYLEAGVPPSTCTTTPSCSYLLSKESGQVMYGRA